MKKAIRIILGLLAGMIVGMLVNRGIISISNEVVPLPEGMDPNDLASVKENVHLFEAKHYVMPFLAHALGTLVAAFVAAKIVVRNTLNAALSIGLLFMVFGIATAYMLGTPFLPSAIDIVFAYFPMALIGRKLAQ